MLKLIKEKMLVSLVVVMLVVMVFGSVNSLATVIKPSSTSNSNTTNTSVENTVGAATSNKNTNNTNKANAISSSVNSSNKTNTSKYNNTNTNKSASKLPYAGTNSSMVFVVIALVASAVYAYKKVSDYNI
ncbi:MAG: hypothetical protein IKL55_00580 [Clostridia bacterium]|nr:hypothetical protein [Clostridia bacterium]